jgi:hypothetical protein
VRYKIKKQFFFFVERFIKKKRKTIHVFKCNTRNNTAEQLIHLEIVKDFIPWYIFFKLKQTNQKKQTKKT